mmetsp:Transcript_6093/g.14263  ORF Transcript_6093/g.14263 Transcript_6093/m.14263 type:complete len:347 (-) Transcript_6093:417-1457(-)|eukprot:CAMPEP_0201123078 /NCGR_PEP_ID=MMETSP0850-20130426/6545_1 /ASSEMBLY_ACC=CAM_ASM_000622 /TAXON_ID=183588 /ORGANISM="Pseudo-nitzschia fraudulenta, Strain WWA7" /LENGTH=346 /DNA_ID=CAMNT_0047389895 /DNA_START=177 /DNA_END=1217 /DNA_ORIENTATION=+
MFDDPFEYLTFGGTFRRSFGLLFERFDLYMGISFCVLIPFAVLYMATVFAMLSVVVGDTENYSSDFAFEHVPLLLFLFAVQAILYDVASVIGQAAISHAVSLTYIGQRPGWFQCLKKAWSIKWSLLGASFLVYGGLFLAFVPAWVVISLSVFDPSILKTLLLFVVGIPSLGVCAYAYTGTLLASPAIIVEGIQSPLQGIKRSWELSIGSRCYLVCTMFCLWSLNQMLSSFLHNLFLRGDVMDAFFSVGGIVVTAILPVVFYFPIHAIIETVLYLNLRIGRESMNHQVLSGEVMSDTPPSSRFRNDDPAASYDETFADYRHVPLMDGGGDDDDDQNKNATAPSTAVV